MVEVSKEAQRREKRQSSEIEKLKDEVERLRSCPGKPSKGQGKGNKGKGKDKKDFQGKARKRGRQAEPNAAEQKKAKDGDWECGYCRAMNDGTMLPLQCTGCGISWEQNVEIRTNPLCGRLVATIMQGHGR